MEGAQVDAAYEALGLPDEQPLPRPIVRATTPRRPVAPGPEEWPVDNRAFVLLDHTTYTSNIVQVVRPLPDLVLAVPEDAGPAGPSHTGPAAGRRPASRTVHQLSFFRGLALVVAVVLSPRLAEAVDLWWVVAWAPVEEWLSAGSIRPLLGQILSRPVGEYVRLVAVGLARFAVLVVLGNVMWKWLYTDLSWNERSTAFGRRALPFQAAYLALFLATPLLVTNEVPRSVEQFAAAALLPDVVYSTASRTRARNVQGEVTRSSTSSPVTTFGR